VAPDAHQAHGLSRLFSDVCCGTSLLLWHVIEATLVGDWSYPRSPQITMLRTRADGCRRRRNLAENAEAEPSEVHGLVEKITTAVTGCSNPMAAWGPRLKDTPTSAVAHRLCRNTRTRSRQGANCVTLTCMPDSFDLQLSKEILHPRAALRRPCPLSHSPNMNNPRSPCPPVFSRTFNRRRLNSVNQM